MTRRLLFLLLLCLAACEEVIEPTAPVLPVAAVSASANSDRAALVALYEATGGPNWRNNENWLTDAPLGEWYGVSVNAEGRVVKLDLTWRSPYNHITWGNNLVGEIPPDLGNLSALQYIRLTDYGISGSIPPELGTLSELEYLNLSSHNLSGPIPPELGNLSELEYLYLGGHGLTGSIPSELGKLSELKTLYLSGGWGEGDSELSGTIPPELGNLSKLRVLILSRHNLSGPIPPELSKLSALEYLWLSGNALTEIPPALGNLSALESLGLSNNALTEIPSELLPGNLSALKNLGLSDNALTEIPPELGKLSALESLWLSGNALTEIPPELGNLSALENLRLNNNNLSDPLPSELGKLSALEYLWLSDNALTELPPELGNLSALQRLWLSGNALTEIPPELGNLSALILLDLSGNPLSGPLPVWFPNLGSLLYLGTEGSDLCIPGTVRFVQWQNKLNGAAFGYTPYCNATDKEVLELIYNIMHGSNWNRSEGWMSKGPLLSDWHGITTDSLGHVVAIELPGNNLRGRYFPGKVGNLTRLRTLDISNNPGIQGRVPLALKKVVLETFRFRGTGLCSPEELREWLAAIPAAEATDEACPPLTDRDILVALYEATNGPNWTNSENWLTDAPLGEWHGVSVNDDGLVDSLRLGANGMTGELPVEIESLSALRYLDLSSNGLSALPPELGNLPALESLDLSRSFLPEIPSSLGNLSTLRRLDLSDNGVCDGFCTGLTEIPSELGNLSALEWLDLRSSGLTEIPPELGNLSALEWLDLRYNGLTEIPPELGNLSALRDLDLSGNDLTGAIPAELGNLSALRHLNLGGNDLTGPIPPELGNLGNLRLLNLSFNRLTGPIPLELGNLHTQELYLQNNDLTGPIPPELDNIRNLRFLNLSYNDLSGSLPPELGSGWLLLQRLELNDNRGLTGALPLSLTGITRWLVEVNTSNTGLCAPTDSVFARWLSALPYHNVRSCSHGGAYLVQASQNFGNFVPLVAGREALLRVFPTAPSGSSVPVPPVRASFYNSGDNVALHTVEIPGKQGPLPAEIDESDLAISANVRIPGDLLQPGLEMVIEVDPNSTLDSALGIVGRIPAEGRTALDIQTLPTMEFTLVPFLWTQSSDTAVAVTVKEMSADPYGHESLQSSRSLLPIHEWTVTAHAPVWFDLRDGQDAMRQLLAMTGGIRRMEGGRGYWMGIHGLFGGGIAVLGGWHSVSNRSGRTIAHELGHNLSLEHAPCGDPDYFTLDFKFPHTGGRSGVWGFDFANDSLIPPHARDLMSYCRPHWISDYHFTNALRHRLSAETSSSQASTSALLLWGGVDSTGTPYMEPAFVVDAPPALPETSGSWTIGGTTATGQTLFTLPFAMPEIADAGEGAGGFAYTLPIRSGWEGLVSITLSGPDNATATLDGSTDRPMSIYRDRNGTVRAILRGDPMQADAMPGPLAGLALDVITSRGIPAVAEWRR